MERNQRTSLQGVVISTKMAKTIVVEVETHKRHAKYAKRVKYSNRYYAHDEKEVANVGDVVTIMGCRPLSATKRFRLVSVDKKALEAIKVEEAEAKLEAKADEKVVEKKVVEAPKAEEVKVEAPVEAPKAETKAQPKKPAAKKTTTTTTKKAPAKKAVAKAE